MGSATHQSDWLMSVLTSMYHSAFITMSHSHTMSMPMVVENGSPPQHTMKKNGTRRSSQRRLNELSMDMTMKQSVMSDRLMGMSRYGFMSSDGSCCPPKRMKKSRNRNIGSTAKIRPSSPPLAPQPRNVPKTMR